MVGGAAEPGSGGGSEVRFEGTGSGSRTSFAAYSYSSFPAFRGAFALLRQGKRGRERRARLGCDQRPGCEKGRSRYWRTVLLLLLGLSSLPAADLFQLPTANRTLLDTNGGGDRFFVGTVGKPWTSGCFGCVRSDGWQMHEGIDIRCLQRDKRGEPTDPVTAAADGTVAYLNPKSALSNYGIYVVLRHQVEGLEIYSFYAHLRAVRTGLKAGHEVKAGETIATLGHTSNTREGIARDRAHVHFELNLMVNDRFSAWYKKASPGQRNDHREWNGQNMLGLDPKLVLLEQQRLGDKFSLLAFIRGQTELCRVTVRQTDFPWLKRYAALVRPNPTADREGIAGYELALNYNGLPFEVIPRAASELPGKAKYRLLSVNESEQKKNPCRKLVAEKAGRWALATRGVNLLDLLTF
jgi:murein DD-endopeptidase MepM/ murein hydrolase activator NlpD